jgi:replicative DNA helicase
VNDDFLKRVPPHDSDAERSVIGAVLIKNEVFDAVAEIITTDDFYHEPNRTIWNGIAALAAAKSSIDTVTLTDALGGKEGLERVGGGSYIFDAAATVPLPSMATHYAKIVHDKSILRQLAKLGGEIAAQAYDSPGHWAPDATEEMISLAEYGIAQIASKQIRKPEPAKTEMLSRALYNLEHGVDNAIATGYPNLDRGFGGFDPGHLSILAARTSKGKTALATNFAINAAKAGIPTAYFTLEMMADEMWLRALGREAQIDMFSARRRGYRDGERERAHAAEKLLDEAPLTILYRPSMRPRDLRLECRRLARETGLKFAVIDYFNLMRGNYRERERWREMAEVILALKEIAGELGIPLLVLSQINREGSEDAPPTIAQLRDTGSAEEHSSNVLLLWQKPQQKDSAPVYDEWEEIDVIIAKQRNGPAGLRVPMQFKKNWGRFESK